MPNISVVHRVSWTKVGLAVLPGLWLLFRQSEILGQLSGSVILIIISLSLAGASFIMERRLAAWSLPAWGVLLWDGWGWVQWLLISKRNLWAGLLNRLYSLFYNLFKINLTLLIWGGGVIIAIFVLYYAYRKSNISKSRLGLALLGLLVLVIMTLACFSYFPYEWLVSTGVFNLLVLLIPIAVGLPLAQRDGLAAGLLVVACEPIWVDMFSNPLHAIRVQAYNSPNSKLELAWLMLSYLPAICFLIITPVGVLRSTSQQKQKWWLTLPPFLTLISMGAIRGFALQGTTDEYTLAWWLRHGLIVVQLCLPLLLTVALYPHQECNISNS